MASDDHPVRLAVHDAVGDEEELRRRHRLSLQDGVPCRPGKVPERRVRDSNAHRVCDVFGIGVVVNRSVGRDSLRCAVLEILRMKKGRYTTT